jgi:hypothetical protein
MGGTARPFTEGILGALSLWAAPGDIVGTRKSYLGMMPELLTDARETSYGI